MGIGGDLAADLAEMMVHRGGIADRHDQRRRYALQEQRLDETEVGEATTIILVDGKQPPEWWKSGTISSGACIRASLKILMLPLFSPQVSPAAPTP
jgi:hypothetical protein